MAAVGLRPLVLIEDGSLDPLRDALPNLPGHVLGPVPSRSSVLSTSSRSWGLHWAGATTLDFERLLRGALRVTPPRVAVPTAVSEHSHADTDSIAGVAREGLGEVSTQAIYDVLRAPTATGLCPDCSTAHIA